MVYWRMSGSYTKKLVQEKSHENTEVAGHRSEV